MSKLRTLGLAAIVLRGLVLAPGLLHADAVPPPPSKCPPGQVGITGHGGPRCVASAPTDCPPGWRGVLGGTCQVYSCQTSAECGPGGRCQPTRVCIHEYLQEWGYGASLALPALGKELYSAPPQRFDPPRRVQEVVDICRAGELCPAESTCGAGSVCLPKGVAAPGHYRPLPPASTPTGKPTTGPRPTPRPG